MSRGSCIALTALSLLAACQADRQEPQPVPSPLPVTEPGQVETRPPAAESSPAAASPAGERSSPTRELTRICSALDEARVNAPRQEYFHEMYQRANGIIRDGVPAERFRWFNGLADDAGARARALRAAALEAGLGSCPLADELEQYANGEMTPEYAGIALTVAESLGEARGSAAFAFHAEEDMGSTVDRELARLLRLGCAGIPACGGPCFELLGIQSLDADLYDRAAPEFVRASSCDAPERFADLEPWLASRMTSALDVAEPLLAPADRARLSAARAMVALHLDR